MPHTGKIYILEILLIFLFFFYFRGFPVKILGTSSVTHLFPTANEEGLISVFDISGKIKQTQNFYVSHFDSPILDTFTKDFGLPDSWVDAYDDGKMIKLPQSINNEY